jgi:predicted Holliday junction resolvase-like endonuclease
MEIIWILLCILELTLIAILCTYIWELKMSAAERVSRLENRLHEEMRNNSARRPAAAEEEYSRRVSALLDMALRQS